MLVFERANGTAATGITSHSNCYRLSFLSSFPSNFGNIQNMGLVDWRIEPIALSANMISIPGWSLTLTRSNDPVKFMVYLHAMPSLTYGGPKEGPLLIAKAG
jgi:hypothetical protein